MVSPLEIKKIVLEKSVFDLNTEFKMEDKKISDLHINYKITFGKSSNDLREGLVRITCDINENYIEQSLFTIKVVMVGIFVTTTGSIEEYLVSAANILLPFIRTHIANLTSNAGVEPVVLPPENIFDLLGENKED